MGTVYAKEKTSKFMENQRIPLETYQKSEINLEGIPARVDRVNINGLARTKDDIIQESVQELFKAQDFQDVVLKAHAVHAKLNNLGCFRNIGIYIDVSKGPNATSDGLEVTFHVREMKRLVGGVTSTVGNNEGSLVIGAKLPNIFGRGERIQTEYSYGSKKTNNFSLQFIKPLLGRYNSVLSSSIYQSLSEWPWSGYRQIDRGLLVELAFDSIPNLGLRHQIQWDGVIRDLGALTRATSFSVREQSGLSLKSSLKHAVSIDFRDENIFPKIGSIIKLTTELAGFGGDVGFLKNELFAQTNIPLLEGITMQFAANFGALNAINPEKKITLADQFFLGGPLTLRGFQTRGVGPHNDGNALGSDVFFGLGAHIYAPLPFSPGKGGFGDLFRTHLFVNAGNVTSMKAETPELVFKSLTEGIRVAYGLGIAIRVAQMARIELNYCFPLQYQRGDQLNPGVQFGIGVQFL